MRSFTFDGLNKPIDVSQDFAAHENAYFNGMEVEFDASTLRGTVQTRRFYRKACISYAQTAVVLETSPAQYFPPAYEEHLRLPMEVSFVSPRAVRIRISARATGLPAAEVTPMLAGPVPSDSSWNTSDDGQSAVCTGPHGRLVIRRNPFRIELYDAEGNLLTRTEHMSDRKSQMNIEPTPVGAVIRAADVARRLCAGFELTHDEKFFGCGESFTRLNKRGQKVVLFASDAIGVMTGQMYKPVPFFMSSRGYGMFIHTSAPLTLDFGNSFDNSLGIYCGDDVLDIFIFLGKPVEILGEYTALTGRSPLPPVWSFGLWMSRMVRESDAAVRASAGKYRQLGIPCDVLHWDTLWYRDEWKSDWEFAHPNFPDPAGLLADLKKQGFRVSLWQHTYLVPGNRLFDEMVAKGYAVLDGDGKLAADDAIIDMSNPAAVKWYQEKIATLLRLGVAVIKVDFGEAAPVRGQYASGRSGFYEHNLYPLRYNQAVGDVTREITGNPFIWARCAWAGSQRYPLHWGGDAETTDAGMAASLRGGLSIGLSGFPFWSHDVGGFVSEAPCPAGLLRRWLMFGLLSSHTRVHGRCDKEPWVNYDTQFVQDFRRQVEFRYRLLPYIYAQAAACSMDGTPMIRALFIDFPDDPTSWLIEDEYLFGRDILVAPLFADSRQRAAYLPSGKWIDYQTRDVYEGGKWHTFTAGDLPAIILVRSGTVIPMAELAQCTDEINWTRLTPAVFATQEDEVQGLVALPDCETPATVKLRRKDGGFVLASDPFEGTVQWL